MAFEKLIQSGHLLEYYKYERNIAPKIGFRGERTTYKQLYRRFDNLNAIKARFRRIVISNMTDKAPYLITLTFRDQKDIKDGYAEFRLFAQRLRNRFSGVFSYIAVPEFGKQGTRRLHFHMLIWGLPDFCSNERDTRFLASIWGLGYLDLKLTDNSDKLASYLSKYVLKALKNDLLFAQKAYTCSRNIKRPVFFSSYDKYTSWGDFRKGWNIDRILSDLGYVDNSVVFQKEYDTMFLGRCVYKIYK